MTITVTELHLDYTHWEQAARIIDRDGALTVLTCDATLSNGERIEINITKDIPGLCGMLDTLYQHWFNGWFGVGSMLGCEYECWEDVIQDKLPDVDLTDMFDEDGDIDEDTASEEVLELFRELYQEAATDFMEVLSDYYMENACPLDIKYFAK